MINKDPTNVNKATIHLKNVSIPPSASPLTRPSKSDFNSTEEKKFKIGETVKHPMYGLCQVTEIRGKKCNLIVIPSIESKTKLQLCNVPFNELKPVKDIANSETV